MSIKTEFNCTDKAWCILDGKNVSQLTVGRVTVVITDSPGTGSDIFDNFKAQKGYKEQYMCVETGIGSGSVFTGGKNIFANKIAADSAVANAEKET